MKNNDWQNLFVVYAGTFAEEENLSEPIQGNYTISADNHIIFSPDSSFTKGHTYYVRFYYPQYYSANNVLKYRSLPGKVAVKEEHFKL